MPPTPSDERPSRPGEPRIGALPTARNRSATVVVALGAVCSAAMVTALLGYGSAAFGAWMTALPPQVERSMTLERAREQYKTGMTVFRVSGVTAIALLGALLFFALRRARAAARRASRPDA